jgi:hypothetical protein
VNVELIKLIRDTISGTITEAFKEERKHKKSELGYKFTNYLEFIII